MGPVMAEERLRPRVSLTLKVVALLLLAALLPMLLVSQLQLRGSLETVQSAEEKSLLLEGQSLARQVDQLLEHKRQTVLMLAEHRLVQDFLAAPPGGRQSLAAAVQGHLQLLMRGNPEFANLYLLDPQGVFVAVTDPGLLGERRQFREYFQRAAAGEMYVSNLLMGIRTPEPGVYFSAPVRGADGALLGVAAVELQGAAIEAILARATSGHQAFLVDQDGLVISHPEAAWRYRSLGQLDPARAAAIRASGYFPDGTLTPLGLAGLENLRGGTGQGGFFPYRGSDGEAWLAAATPLQRQTWTLLLAEPERLFRAPLDSLFQRSLGFLALAGLGLLLLAVAWGRALSRPLLAMTESAARLQRGDYAAALEAPALLALDGRRDELGTLARVLRHMGEEVYRREFHLDQQVRVRTAELEQAHARVAGELCLAREMQQAILPQDFPRGPGWACHGAMIPAREMGGDFYDCIPLAGGRLGLVVADVSGKGVPAAFFMAVCRTLLEEAARELEAPGAVLARANELLCARNPLAFFVTVLYGVFDPARGRFTYASAGHHPPLLRRAPGWVSAGPTACDLALGVLEGADYQEFTLQLGPGDLLLLSTDGVDEACSPQGEQFGAVRLQQWLAARAPGADPGDCCRDLLQELGEYEAGEAADDVTLLCLSLTDPAPGAWQCWELPPRLESIGVLARALEIWLGARGAAAAGLAYPANLSLDELLTNAITHGQPADGAAPFRLGARLDPDGLALQLHIPWQRFDPFAAAPAPDLSLGVAARPVGGLGLHLVRSCMDRCEARVDALGTWIELYKGFNDGKDRP